MKVIYKEEQKRIAIQTYKKLKSYANALRVHGYPSRHILFDWVINSQKRGRPSKKSTIKAKRYSYDLKLKAVTLSLEGVNAKQIASELDITTHAIIYDWLKKYRIEGEEGLHPNKLSNKLKVEIILALVNIFPLQILLEELDLKRSSFYYAKLSLSKPDKYHHIRSLIHEISESSFYTYGSPRIWFSLKKRHYSSYIGEITPACKNTVNNNFHATGANKLWLTDIIEFSAKDSKVCLSPVIDCFDGMVVPYATSTSPNQSLVDEMLEKVLSTVKSTDEFKNLVIHTDRGGHYRGGR